MERELKLSKEPVKELIHHHSWYSKVTYKDFTFVFFIRDEKGEFIEYTVRPYDTYILDAVEKMERLKVDRDKLNYGLAIGFRDAIRENENKMLGLSYAHIRNVKGIEAYIKRVWDKYEKQSSF